MINTPWYVNLRVRMKNFKKSRNVNDIDNGSIYSPMNMQHLDQQTETKYNPLISLLFTTITHNKYS